MAMLRNCWEEAFKDCSLTQLLGHNAKPTSDKVLCTLKKSNVWSFSGSNLMMHKSEAEKRVENFICHSSYINSPAQREKFNKMARSVCRRR